MSRMIINDFEATPVARESGLTCRALEEIGLTGGQQFTVGMPVLNSSLFPERQSVRSVPVVQFTCGDSLLSYCVEQSVFESSTKQIEPWK